MKYSAMMKAHSEARRLARLIEQVREQHPEFKDYMVGASKYCSALKRASMDLTRALAEMRKP